MNKFKLFKKSHFTIALILFCSTTSSYAAMDTTSVLTFTPATTGGLEQPAAGTGSWFGMEAGDYDFDGIVDTIHTPIESNEGIKLGIIQNASGSHNGAIDGTENPSVDNAWSFFSNVGMHETTGTAITVLTDDGAGNVTLDMTGWTVDWNGGEIDMGAGADAVVTCANTCEFGDTYTLDYNAIVPTGSFAGVPYSLHLEGTVTAPATNQAPVASNFSVNINRKASGRPYTADTINVLNNVSDPNGASNLDITSLTIIADVSNGSTSVDTSTGLITYTPNDDYLGADSFTYKVSDLGDLNPGSELESNTATVSISVVNALPTAIMDTGSINTDTDSSVIIDVTSNDIDPDGSIDAGSVNIVTDVTLNMGTTSVNNSTGEVTYTPKDGFAGTANFTYEVNDNDGATSPIPATVNISVSSGSGTLENTTYLVLQPGNVPAALNQPPLGNGSWFSMEVTPGQPLHTGITGFDHLLISPTDTQPATESQPGIDKPWAFFGNQGIHLTTSPVTILTDDNQGNVTLNFGGWAVSWNAIPVIPMGSGQDNGIATLTCDTDCSNFDRFYLDYRAIVPVGDPSGFGGVNYRIHLEGIINRDGETLGGGNIGAAYSVSTYSVTDANNTALTFNAGPTATQAGKESGTGLTAEDIGIDPLLNPNNGAQCIGGCIDFSINGITTDYIDLVVLLSEEIPDGAIYRKYINNKWVNFDQSSGDLIGSAPTSNGQCQSPEGVFSTGLRSGSQCLYIRIHDGGPNDDDGLKNGTIIDPSGVLLSGSSNIPVSSTDGCNMSGTSVAAHERADWWLLAGFIALLGWFKMSRRKA